MNEFLHPASLLAHPEQAPIQVQRILFRKSRPHLFRLVEGSDGACYRAKFLTAPNSKSLLINQWLDSFFLRHLGVAAPTAQILHVPSDMAKSDPELCVLLDQQTDQQQAVVCLGLSYPAHPEQRSSFGFLPQKFWDRVVNPLDLAIAFVLDQLLGMNSYRHILFTRDHPCHSNLFRAHLVANPNIFGGTQWKIENRLDLKSYCSWHLYPTIAPACWLAALELVGSQPLPDCQTALAGLPAAWLGHDEQLELEHLFEELQRRQPSLAEWIQIPSGCLQFPAYPTLEPIAKPPASVIPSPALSPA